MILVSGCVIVKYGAAKFGNRKAANPSCGSTKATHRIQQFLVAYTAAMREFKPMVSTISTAAHPPQSSSPTTTLSLVILQFDVSLHSNVSPGIKFGYLQVVQADA